MDVPLQLLRPRPGPSHQAGLMGSDSFPGAPCGSNTKAHIHAHRTYAQAHAQPEIPTLTYNTHTHTHPVLIERVLWHTHGHLAHMPSSTPMCTHACTLVVDTLSVYTLTHSSGLAHSLMAPGLSYGASCAFLLAARLACEACSHT